MVNKMREFNLEAKSVFIAAWHDHGNDAGFFHHWLRLRKMQSLQ
jgi:hypothetical protein